MEEEDRKKSLRMISFGKILANKLLLLRSYIAESYGRLRASNSVQDTNIALTKTSDILSHVGNNLWGVYQRHITNDFCILVTLLFTIADRIVQVYKILILGVSIQYFWVVLFVLRNPDRIT